MQRITLPRVIAIAILAIFTLTPFITYADEFKGPVRIEGKGLVTDHGRFMVRGVALAGVDAKANDDLLADDHYEYILNKIIPKLESLHVNAIRVFRVDPSKSHDKVMNLLKNKGIYVYVELMNEKVNVNRVAPIYNDTLYTRVKAVVDAFAKYDNVLAFSVGNELVFPGNIIANVKSDPAEVETNDARVEKSLIRDTKQYLRDSGKRLIPVGVSMQDGPSSSMKIAEKNAHMVGTDVVEAYYACQTEDTKGSNADFIGINSYRYVTPNKDAPLNNNAYDNHVKEVEEFSVPVLFTEIGAQNRDSNGTPQITRDWAIIPYEYITPTLYNQFSGEFAFMFFDTKEKLGLYQQPDEKLDLHQQNKGITETNYGPGISGGAEALSKVYAKVSEMTPPPPAIVEKPTVCPVGFNPPLYPTPGKDPSNTISITIINYSDKALKVVQNGNSLGDLPTSGVNGNEGNPLTIKVSPKYDLFLLLPEGKNWPLSCKLPLKMIREGSTVKNTNWGGDCLVELVE
jgi:hypothetical protein